MSTRPAKNHVIALSPELVMTGILRRDMASPLQRHYAQDARCYAPLTKCPSNVWQVRRTVTITQMGYLSAHDLRLPVIVHKEPDGQKTNFGERG
jgi:hypothetical protein